MDAILLVARTGVTRGEEIRRKLRTPGWRARRWLVEACHERRASTLPSWRCRIAPHGLEESAVHDVGAKGHGWLETEEEDQERRHERPAAHPGQTDERPNQKPGEDDLPGHATNAPLETILAGERGRCADFPWMTDENPSPA
jgi:hypothetical protein